MTALAPILECRRLLLRPCQPSDFDPMAARSADPLSACCVGPHGRDDTWRQFAVYSGHWLLRGYGA